MSSKKASFAISIDLELAWGCWDKTNSEIIRKIITQERPICKKLLQIFDENELPVTWAVVTILDSNGIMNGKEDQKHGMHLILLKIYLNLKLSI